MTNKNQWGKVRCDLERGMVHGGEAEVPDKGIQTPFIYDKESWGGRAEEVGIMVRTVTVKAELWET